ncbi:MAG: hypothetical protein AAGC46_11865 [Solirubrobacteraceae bacterium]|nr:hypothetical protein [Patulibacter sp.]
MFTRSGARRHLGAAALAAALACAAAPAVASAAGPVVSVQVNGLAGQLVHADRVQLGTPGTDLPHRAASAPHADGIDTVTCNADSGVLPADSIAAAVEAVDPAWTWTSDPDDGSGQATIRGTTASTTYPNAEDTGWHLWVDSATDSQYWNLTNTPPGVAGSPWCAPLQDGDTLVVQDSSRLDPGTGTPVPTTTHAVLRNLPKTVLPGATITPTLQRLLPANHEDPFSSWYSFNGAVAGVSAPAGQAYTVGLPQYGVSQAVGADGSASLTLPDGASGYVTVGGYAGTTGSLPTADTHDSAYATPQTVCVYRPGNTVQPCQASVTADAPVFGTQATESIGAPRSITITPVRGRAAVDSVEITGDAIDDYSISSSTCTGAGAALDSGTATPTTCVVKVRFAPSVVGNRSATLVVHSSAQNGTLTVPLTGTGGPKAAGTPGATGAQGAAGQNGTNGTNGSNGADGAPGPAGPAGATGGPGAAGAPGATGPAGKAGRDAVCTVKGTKKLPKVTCTLTTPTSTTAKSPAVTSSTKATLTRGGKTVATGTIASLRAKKSLAEGTYTLRYRSHGDAVAITVRIG